MPIILVCIILLTGCASGHRAASDYLDGFRSGYVQGCMLSQYKAICEDRIDNILRNM